MPEYAVVIDTLEGNEDNASLTGTVNGVPVAAVLKVRLLAPSIQKVLSETGRYPRAGTLKTTMLAEALVDAFEKRSAPSSGPTAITVTR